MPGDKNLASDKVSRQSRTDRHNRNPFGTANLIAPQLDLVNLEIALWLDSSPSVGGVKRARPATPAEDCLKRIMHASTPDLSGPL